MRWEGHENEESQSDHPNTWLVKQSCSTWGTPESTVTKAGRRPGPAPENSGSLQMLTFRQAVEEVVGQSLTSGPEVREEDTAGQTKQNDKETDSTET